LTDKLAILLWAATPNQPALCVTPLVHALAARALDAEVEIHFAGPAVRLLVVGVAAKLFPTPSQEKSLGEFLDEVSAEGVSLLACSMASAAWIESDEQLLPGCSAAGATAFVARTLDPAWRTLVY
jgi:predicted peroxiredoxin